MYGILKTGNHHTLEGHSSLAGVVRIVRGILLPAAAHYIKSLKLGEYICKLDTASYHCFQHDSLKIVSGSEIMLKLWDINSGKICQVPT